MPSTRALQPPAMIDVRAIPRPESAAGGRPLVHPPTRKGTRMQTTMDRSFFRQVVGAAKLDRATYDAVARDPSATTSAALVVALASLAAGLAAAVDDGLSAIALAVVAGFVFWALSAVSASSTT